MKNPINFNAGKMNKDLDLKMIPAGEYVDAQNIRVYNQTLPNNVGGSVTPDYGTIQIAPIVNLTGSAKTIGSFSDEANDTIYWFVVDSGRSLVLSFNVISNLGVVHIDDNYSKFNFSEDYPIVSVNKVDDLLFWTDGLNPPRYINVRKAYDPLWYPANDIYGDIDTYTCVIKTPPPSSPTVQLINDGTESNYLAENMVSFAYRYRYEDNMYSALSQFSSVAFDPKDFAYNANTGLNDGMTNTYNSADITVNLGGQAVVGIDVVFKRFSSNTIYLIERIDKADIPPYVSHTIRFQNNKMYSILPSDELVRLYDNVPISAKSQVIAGNRLIYGNYVDGRDLKDPSNVDVRLDYTPTAVNQEIGSVQQLTHTLGNQTIYVGSLGPTLPAAQQTLANSLATITIPVAFQGNILPGFTFGFSANVVPVSQAYRFTGAETSVTPTTPQFPISFSFTAQKFYANFLQMVTSSEFSVALGSDIDYYADPITNCSSGYSLADRFACQITTDFNTAENRNKAYLSNSLGLTGANQGPNYAGFSVGSGTTSSSLQILMPQVSYATVSSGVLTGYALFNFANFVATAGYQKGQLSLHSNRDYQVGIVYMDKNHRSSPVLVSNDNSVYFQASSSVRKNYIQVSVPPSQRPPSWATKYKFVIQPTKERYDTFYGRVFYTDPSDKNVWIKLEGEFQKTVSVGQKLIVKKDTNGPLSSLVYATVLATEVQPSNFITGTTSISELPGFYAKFKAEKWSANYSDTTFSDTGLISNRTSSGTDWSFVNIPLFTFTSPSSYVKYDVPAGSIVDIYIYCERAGRCSGNPPYSCGMTKSVFSKRYIASTNYPDIKAFWDGEGVDVTTAIYPNTYCVDNGGENGQYYNNVLASSAPFSTSNGIQGRNRYQFYTDPVNANALYLAVQNGSARCGIPGARNAWIDAQIKIQRTDSVIVFETLPENAVPELYYENEQSFDISPIDAGSFHQGNVQNQTAILPAIVNLSFANCVSFGNGVESMSIEDSITGDYLKLGHRVHSISTGYKLTNRFSDMTYSGVYNRESNVNNLNEFNLGLLNFKTLEPFYGSIQYMYPRESDILVFQEDKVSKVLLGKNILSDAVGGSTLASIPEVLGNQVPRPEEYGIDKYPETFAVYGDKIYFTDAKRGAVIQMMGDSMTRISDIGMISYFRNALINNNGLKRGGYDPYMRDYVFHYGEPVAEIQNIECGTTFNLNEAPEGYPGTIIRAYYSLSYPYPTYGTMQVSFNWLGAGRVYWRIFYDGTEVESGLTDDTTPFYQTSVGGINQSVNPPYVEVEILDYNAGTDGSASITIGCPSNSTITPVMVVLSDGADAGKMATQVVGPSLIRNYQFETQLSGSGEYIDHLDPTQFGSEMLPDSVGGTFNMHTIVRTNGFSPNVTDTRFKLLLSNTLYGVGQGSLISSLAGQSRTIVADNNSFSPSPSFVSATTLTLSSLPAYAYYVWDYRKSGIAINLCEGASSNLACCGTCNDSCVYINTNAAYSAYGGYGICSSLYNLVIYRSSSTVVVGSKFMLNMSATIPALPGWYKFYDGSDKVAQVGSLGSVLLVQPC
jgi:hypothetical protein